MLSLLAEARWRLAGRLASTVAMILVVGCAAASHPAAPVFTTGVWRIRIDVDSAPTRRPPKQPLFGTIDFAARRYAIDLQHSISPWLPNGAIIAPVGGSPASSTEYRVILGDSSSFDTKIVMHGRLVARDSIVGTWSETIVCCSAAGRFSLWRATSTVGR